MSIFQNYSGAFLEDAVVVSCGHSFGGFMLKRVMETVRNSNMHLNFYAVDLPKQIIV